jgi:hypothetical protein
MSDQNPYVELGVTENSSFEEIQEAKKRLLAQHQEDSPKLQAIETAYDAIIMDRLRMRQEGKIKVPERIRYPEKSVESLPKPSVINTSQTPNWIAQLIDRPSQNEILLPLGVYSAFGSLVAFYPLLVTAPQAFPTSLLLALAFGANVYFINRKENRFGRAVLFSTLGLIVGIILGSVVANLLDTQGINFLNSEQLACLVAFFLFWVISSFLR